MAMAMPIQLQIIPLLTERMPSDWTALNGATPMVTASAITQQGTSLISALQLPAHRHEIDMAVLIQMVTAPRMRTSTVQMAQYGQSQTGRMFGLQIRLNGATLTAMDTVTTPVEQHLMRALMMQEHRPATAMDALILMVIPIQIQMRVGVLPKVQMPTLRTSCAGLTLIWTESPIKLMTHARFMQEPQQSTELVAQIPMVMVFQIQMQIGRSTTAQMRSRPIRLKFPMLMAMDLATMLRGILLMIVRHKTVILGRMAP